MPLPRIVQASSAEIEPSGSLMKVLGINSACTTGGISGSNFCPAATAPGSGFAGSGVGVGFAEGGVGVVIFVGSAFVGSAFGGSTFAGSARVGSAFVGSTFVASTLVASTFVASTFVASTFAGPAGAAGRPVIDDAGACSGSTVGAGLVDPLGCIKTKSPPRSKRATSAQTIFMLLR